jgi:hypothetical protein
MKLSIGLQKSCTATLSRGGQKQSSQKRQDESDRKKSKDSRVKIESLVSCIFNHVSKFNEDICLCSQQYIQNI